MQIIWILILQINVDLYKYIIKAKFFYWNLLKTKQKECHCQETSKNLFDTNQEKYYWYKT